MLKVYVYKRMVSDIIDDYSVVDVAGFQLLEESEVQNKVDIFTWDELYDLIKQGQLCQFNVDKSIFRKRPFFYQFTYGGIKRRFYKSDKKFKIETRYKESNILPMMSMMEKFPADKMIQYFKEHGLNICSHSLK